MIFPMRDHKIYLRTTRALIQASLFGLIANLVAIVCVYRLPSLHNSFGVLCSSNCAASFAILSIFAAWVAPATLW